MDIMSIANSPAMWIACAVPVCFVVLQAVLFLREARKAGAEMGLTADQMKNAMRSSAVTSIGPSLELL